MYVIFLANFLVVEKLQPIYHNFKKNGRVENPTLKKDF